MTLLRAVALSGALLVYAEPAVFAQAPAPTTPTAANPWFQGAPFPDASEEVLGATAGGKLYVFAGLAPGWKPKALVFEYDPASNQWAKKRPMRLASHHVAFASLNDKIYAFGGFTLPDAGPPGWAPINNAWEYDPTTDEWKASRRCRPGAARPPRPWPTARLRHRRRQLASRCDREWHPSGAGAQRAADGRGIRPGDEYLENGAVAAAVTQSPCRGRRRQPSLRHRRSCRRGLHLERQQQCRSGGNVRPATDLWTPRARMPTARSAIGAGVYNNNILVAGGEGQDQRFLAAFKAVEAYDTALNRWQVLPSMSRPRHGLAVGAIGNRLYTVSGDGQSAGSGIEHGAVPYNEILALDLVLK